MFEKILAPFGYVIRALSSVNYEMREGKPVLASNTNKAGAIISAIQSAQVVAETYALWHGGQPIPVTETAMSLAIWLGAFPLGWFGLRDLAGGFIAALEKQQAQGGK